MTLALSYLENEPSLPIDENPLNQRLAVFCIRAEHELANQGLTIFAPLTWESKNQPRPEDQDGAGYLEKRPDFQASLRDYSVGDWKECAIDYHIECKRLGSATASGWVLNRNYIENGENRFIDPLWRYSRGAQSAAMVGYMQTMEPDSILAEVNGHAMARTLPAITCSAWTPRGVTALDPTSLNRNFHPSPVRLKHLWVDLRHCTFFQAQSPPNTRKSRSGTRGTRRPKT
jgi:hypothetical protein